MLKNHRISHTDQVGLTNHVSTNNKKNELKIAFDYLTKKNLEMWKICIPLLFVVLVTLHVTIRAYVIIQYVDCGALKTKYLIDCFA